MINSKKFLQYQHVYNAALMTFTSKTINLIPVFYIFPFNFSSQWNFEDLQVKRNQTNGNI